MKRFGKLVVLQKGRGAKIDPTGPIEQGAGARPAKKLGGPRGGTG